MFKKVISLTLTLALILSITACDNSGGAQITTTSSTTAATTTTAEVTTTTDVTTTEKTTTAATTEITTTTESTTENTTTATTTKKPVTTTTTPAVTTPVVTTKKEPVVTIEELSNPNASATAQKLFKYIQGLEGKGILAGQQESTWVSGPDYEMKYISNNTGKLPAIRGFDYINNDFLSVTTRAIKWWEQDGGIVSICWHWGAPPDGVGYDSSKGEIDMTEALTEGTDLYNALIDGMDVAAQQLKRLADKNVPVLWRPFHEFDGQWFWWGKGTPEQFIELWRLMYDRFTNHWGLNNLIWVLGYADTVKKGWYPGDEYVDIIGSDTYKTRVDTINSTGWEMMNRNLPDCTKARCFHENGQLPDIDMLISKKVNWTWFLTWTTEWLMEKNTVEELNEVYNHEYVITLDELPDF